jgi:tetratricopeptide (TPR) repeat protein
MDSGDEPIAQWRWWVLAGTGALGLLFLLTGLLIFGRSGGFEGERATPPSVPGNLPSNPPNASGSANGLAEGDRAAADPNTPAQPNTAPSPTPETETEALPTTALGYYQRGEAAQNSGDWPTAIAAYREAILRDPRLDRARLNLAIALSQSDRPAEALAEFEQAARVLPDSPDLHYHWGNAYSKTNKPADAIAAYRRAIALNPTYADAHYNLGNTLAKAGELDRAADAYRTALSTNPNLAEAHGNLGLVLLQQGDRAAARQALTQARDQFQRTNRRDRAQDIEQLLQQLDPASPATP